MRRLRLQGTLTLRVRLVLTIALPLTLALAHMLTLTLTTTASADGIRDCVSILVQAGLCNRNRNVWLEMWRGLEA